MARFSIEDRRLGVVFQSYDLFPHLTASENIDFALQARGFSKPERQARRQKWLSRLGLQNRADEKALYLSGGEKQKVALARALVADPQVVLLDEPFSALDPESRNEARKLVKEVLAEQKCPVYLITHDAQDVEHLAQFQVSLSRGKVIGTQARG